VTHITGIIPAVNDTGQLQAFFRSGYGMCVLMNFSISELGGVFENIARKGRRALVHCDLIHGLSGDEYAAKFLAGFNPAGILSTKPAVVTACKKLGVTAIQRVFLIDGSALAKSIQSVKKANPDYVELLPAPCLPALPMLRSEFSVPLIAGGLIQSKAMAEEILGLGVRAVTVSMSTITKG
jgi:glycerol uptake operon antiterminator